MPLILPLVVLVGGLLILLAMAAACLSEWPAALVLGVLGVAALTLLSPLFETDESRQNLLDELGNGGFFDD